MHKGIRLTLSVSIQGEQAAPEDFAALTIAAIREILAAGQAAHPELVVTLRKVEEDTNYDDDLESADTGEDAPGELKAA